MYKNFLERLFFLVRALSGHRVGAITTSSRYVIQEALQDITGPLDTIVEYGAGTGTMTKNLLQRLAPNGKLIVIESNHQFIEILKQLSDTRLHIIEGELENQLLDAKHGFFNVDLVVSSVPFSFIAPMHRQKIILASKKMLAPNGNFIIFHQYSRLMLKPLKDNFKTVSVSFEPRNIFPCFIFSAKK
jgi:phospholipid N-methyltransferase